MDVNSGAVVFFVFVFFGFVLFSEQGTDGWSLNPSPNPLVEDHQSGDLGSLKTWAVLFR